MSGCAQVAFSVPVRPGPASPCTVSSSLGAQSSCILAEQMRGAGHGGTCPHHGRCHCPLGRARRLWKEAGPSLFSRLFDPTPRVHHPNPASSGCSGVTRGGGRAGAVLKAAVVPGAVQAPAPRVSVGVQDEAWPARGTCPHKTHTLLLSVPTGQVTLKEKPVPIAMHQEEFKYLKVSCFFTAAYFLPAFHSVWLRVCAVQLSGEVQV